MFNWNIARLCAARDRGTFQRTLAVCSPRSVLYADCEVDFGWI
jgi:hypothetical protein